MRCPTCKQQDSFVPWEGMSDVWGFEIEGRGERCRTCGEILIRFGELGRMERIAAQRIVARGIRTGSEFKFVRKLAGFQATEVAEMFGVRKPCRGGSATRSRSREPRPTPSARCSSTRS
jgi:hypothetical protein